MYNVKIVEKEEKKLTAFVLHTTFENNRQSEKIPPFFHKIMAEQTLENVPDRSNKNQICAIVKEETAQAFDYYMGVETTHFKNTPPGMETLVIPPAKYATASFVKKGNADVLNAFMSIVGQWLAENSYAQNFKVPPFIYYDDKFLPIYKAKGYDKNPVADIFIPVC